MTLTRRIASAATAALLVALGSALVLGSLHSTTTRAAGYYQVVPRPSCGPGSSPEDGFQGEVPLADRLSGRSQMGYWCNLQLVGQYQGEGTSWQNTWYDHCDYFDTADNTGAEGTGIGGQKQLGSGVVDVTDPAHPQVTAWLTSPGMLHPWESLKVNEKRGLLAGQINGQAPFDIYDVKGDCAHPRELASVPMPNNGHEGNWAPDGMTYWSSSTSEYHAIDVSDPSHPKQLISWVPLGRGTHGLSISDDGTRGYFTTTALLPAAVGGQTNGLVIADISDIQYRRPNPQIRVISDTTWPDGSIAQSTQPITIGGKPYIVFFDENGSGGLGAGENWFNACAQGLPPFGVARIFDISDEKAPKLVSRITLQTDDPNNCEVAATDETAGGQVIFGYDSHYCYPDQFHDATALACGYFNSGIRIFDIRNPSAPREIAYFNPPAQLAKQGQLPGSEHDAITSGTGVSALTADWCATQARFYSAPDGNHYLWATCQDNGFMVLKFTNGAYPLSAPATSVQAAALSNSAVVKAASTLPNTSTGDGAMPAVPLLVLFVEALLVVVVVRRMART